MKIPRSLLLALSVFLFAGARSAHAGIPIPIFYSTGTEKIVKAATFPDAPEFKTETGEHIDAGYKFKQVQIFWIPLWNYGGEWCGYVGRDDTYMEIPKVELDAMAAHAQVTLPEKPGLGFWNSYFSKVLLLLLVVGVGVLYLLPSNEEKPAA